LSGKEKKMKLVGYENNNRVEASAEENRPIPAEPTLHPRLKPVLDVLLLDKPLWHFKVTNFGGFNYAGVVLRIFKDNEELGHVSYARVGYSNSNLKYKVHNDRIDSKMQRRSFYSTESVDKAVAMVKKTFSSKTVQELMNDAENAASQEMHNLRSNKYGAYNSTRQVVEKALMEYAASVGWGPFVEHMRNTDVRVFNTIEKRDELYTEFKHMDEIESAYRNDKALFVLRCDTIYSVKQGDNTVRHSNDDLPEDLKRKLGLLKLVEPKQYLSGVGFRADQDAFVVLPSEEKSE
jgi:hypothetical protein